MEEQKNIHKLNLLLWMLIVIPAISLVFAEANKNMLIWRFRLVDFVDLILIAPLSLIILMSLHKIVFEHQIKLKSQWLSISLIGIFLYGHAMHVTANSINTYSTEIHDYLAQIPSDTYDLIYFFDEDLGHWLLYNAIFLILGLWEIESKISGKTWSAMATGIIMGLSYSVAIIESSHFEIGFIAATWLLSCNIKGSRIANMKWTTRFYTHLFSAFTTTLAFSLVVGETIYAILVGGFIQPSQLGI